MDFLSENKTITPLSFSIVLIWRNQLNTLPPISQEFCEGLFDDGNTYKYFLGRNGIVVNQLFPINHQPLNIPGTLQVGFDRLVLTHMNRSILLSSYKKLEKEFNRLMFTDFLSVGQMGINIEYEVSDNEDFDGQQLINNRFSNPMNDKYFLGSSISDIKITFLESADDHKLVNITLQPRGNKINALYFKINDHYTKIKTQTFLSDSELSDYIKDSEQKFESKVLTSLF